MSGMNFIHDVEQLKPFVNDKGFIEIVTRGKNQKFKQFHNIVIDNLSKTQDSEALQTLIKNTNKIQDMEALNLVKLENLTKLSSLNVLLSGANLCATCVGFAIMYAKLDKMSKEINQKLEEIQNNIKDINDNSISYMFNNVISDHRNMLDKKEIKKPFSEERMHQLVADEYNLLDLLIKSLKKDVSNDNKQLVYLIVTVASMMSASLIDYDELYYFNNREVLTDRKRWHASHDIWMSAFETLSEPWFIKKLQDNGFFELRLDTIGVDAYYETILEQVGDMKQSVEDNMELICIMDDNGAIGELRNNINKEVLQDLESAIKETCAEIGDPEFESVCNEAVRAVS